MDAGFNCFSDCSGTDEVWKVPVTGGAVTKVTSHGGRMPVEAPDGKFLYYVPGCRGRVISRVGGYLAHHNRWWGRIRVFGTKK